MIEQSSAGIIEMMMEDHRELMEHLRTSGSSISLQSRVDADFSKTLLLSAASYFETKIIDDVINVFYEATSGSDALVFFVRDKAASRGYSSWFSWDRPNANKFFGSFGPGFRALMQENIKNEPELANSIRAFMEIGSIRNELVHQNFAQYTLDKTVDEVFDLYESAARFVDRLPDDIRQHINRHRSATVTYHPNQQTNSRES